MNQFVSDAICKELELKKEELKKAYTAANKDDGQREAMVEWESTIGDGSEQARQYLLGKSWSNIGVLFVSIEA